MKLKQMIALWLCLMLFAGCGVQSVPEETPLPADSSVKNVSNADKAKKILQKLSLEEKVGQMFFVRCPDTGAVQSVKDYGPGGYILFARDFKEKTKDDVISAVEQYQKAAKIPMLIGVDEEGGTVNRVSRYKAFRASPFHSPQALFAEGGFELIQRDTAEKAALLKQLGINVNFAPVCDVSLSTDDYIYLRAFGQDAEKTAQYVQTVTGMMKQHQIGSVMKHFPGYGPNSDTHTGFSKDDRSYVQFQENDFIPFLAGQAAGADSILVCHNVVTCVDSEYPASLSANWHRVLRDELKFSGVVMTDDLVMQAITDAYGIEDAAVLAVQAGNDMLVSTDYKKQIGAVIQAVSDGRISEQDINKAVIRVLCWKLSLGLIA